MLGGYFFYFQRHSSPVGQALLIHQVSRSHATTHHSRQDSSGLVISPTQRPLPDNTQQSQQTDIHAPGGIRTHSLSRQAAVGLMLVGYTNFKLRCALNVTLTLHLSADWPHALLQVHSTHDLLPADKFQVVKRLLTIFLTKSRQKSEAIKTPLEL